MSGNQLPVLTLDIDEEKIRQLNEISEKFKAAFGVGPGGFPAQVPPPPIPGTDKPAKKPGGKQDSGFDKFLKNLNKEAQGTLKTFGLINKTLSLTTSTLKGLFTTTLSWGAKVAALSVAGPFGYSMMARSVSDTYRTSQGMNISTGQMQAANNVYGTRLSGTSNIMQTLAAAQNDPQNPAYAGLLSLGINPQEGAAANMPKLLERVSGLLKQYKKTGVSQTVLNGMGLGSLIDSTTANQVIANSDRLPMLNQQYREQSARLDKDMGSGTQESYQGVYANFSNNADQISNTFLKALSRLNGPITQLSDSLTASIQKFLNGKNGKALFDSMASGLEKVANWLGGDDFQNDLKTFADCVKAIVQALGQAIKWIAGNVPGVDLGGTGTGKEGADPALVKFGDKYLGGNLPGANPMTNKYTGIFTEEAAREKYQMPDALKGNIQNFVQQANDAAGLPSGLMSAIAEKESSWNPLAINKGSGAAGLFQFMPGTAKGYGLEGEDVFDPNKATIAAAKYLSDNMKHYDGDIAKSLTQYNGGRIDKKGNLSLKKETVDYLIKILPKVQGGLEQHPGIMAQLSEARGNLANADKDTRATIKLDINQMPGSDISAQVKGIYVNVR
ncbi:transglycosylase SLT domain-containing protein [Buttiauxella sp. S19-1]|uniref:transglycosylase SLT domain-containing protein n=1 Tax=Buttiauxella sp. S19-1 TaxID=941430 RepID=UPI001EDB1349|nr:lytic transglycosylase domain-containing protein [Buttiauxella sp. S19-1]